MLTNMQGNQSWFNPSPYLTSINHLSTIKQGHHANFNLCTSNILTHTQRGTLEGWLVAKWIRHNHIIQLVTFDIIVHAEYDIITTSFNYFTNTHGIANAHPLFNYRRQGTKVAFSTYAFWYIYM